MFALAFYAALSRCTWCRYVNSCGPPWVVRAQQSCSHMLVLKYFEFFNERVALILPSSGYLRSYCQWHGLTQVSIILPNYPENHSCAVYLCISAELKPAGVKATCSSWLPNSLVLTDTWVFLGHRKRCAVCFIKLWSGLVIRGSST